MRVVLMFALLATLPLLGCEPSGTAPSVRPAAVAAPPATPAKPMKMVCRNSQTGEKAVCGTPNAVMVGMEPA